MPKTGDNTLRLPPWLKPKLRGLGGLHEMKKRLRAHGLHTVCESARCPNIGECFLKTVATVMIMGDRCTRSCTFCAVGKGAPKALEPREPEQAASLAEELKLKHLVITSVTRDDLPDGGAAHFLACVEALKARLPEIGIELLTPDFRGDESVLETLTDAPIKVFNHNVETVARLYAQVRPQADFRRSLNVLKYMAARRPDWIVKSGFMLGLGETADEVMSLLKILADNGVGAVTIGQYMRPSLQNHPVVRYVPPEEFERYRKTAVEMGYRYVASAPLVRSSYMAEQLVDSGIDQ